MLKTSSVVNGGVDVVFGGQAGSEGKGAIVGYLARRNPRYKAAICTFMTNAGHTWVDDNTGSPVMVQQIPMSVVAPEIDYLMIGPSSAITPSTLLNEISKYDREFNVSERLRIHPRAMIIQPEDVELEKTATKHVASTQKGCGAALARKAMRKNVTLAKDISWMKPFIADTTALVNRMIADGHLVLAEGSQGFDLDINHGIEYPYCTSRQTTPLQVMADCGIPHTSIREVIAVLRTYPIRVGNIVGKNGEVEGYSGPFGGNELTWDEITRRSGYPYRLEEKTTVTKRVRRIFEMDHDRLRYMFQVCAPTQVALTFADYIDWDLLRHDTRLFAEYICETAETNSRAHGTIWPKKFYDFMTALERVEGCPPISLVKTGPRDSDMINMEKLSEFLVGYGVLKHSRSSQTVA